MANINIDQLAADLRRIFYAQVPHYGAWVVLLEVGKCRYVRCITIMLYLMMCQVIFILNFVEKSRTNPYWAGLG